MIVVIRGQLTVVVKEESWDCIELVVYSECSRPDM